MNKAIKINLQLFAEETIPGKEEDKNLDSKPDEKKEPSKNPFSRLFQMDSKKPEDKKVEDKKPESKAEDKKPEDVKKDPDTKEPEDKKKEEEFITIKHLGKEVKVPAAERDKYLQMGYDYGYVKEEATKAKTALQRIAKLEGFDKVEDYLAELDKKEKTKLAEQIEEAGSDTEKIDEIIKNHPIVRQTQEEKQKLDEERRQLERQGKIDALKKEQFFKELEPELNQLMDQNPNADPNLVYSVLVGNYVRTGKLDELVKKTKESAEKKVVADIHDKERRATPTGGDSGEGKDYVQPTEFGSKIGSIFGLPKEAKQRAAQRSYEKMKRS